MKLVRRLIYFSAAFILGAGALLAVFYDFGQEFDLFEVSSIPVEILDASEDSRVKGAPAVGSEMRNRLEGAIREFANKRIWEVDLGELKASIVRDEWVSDVLISRSLPNEIKVSVRAKTPVLVYVSSSGEFFPVTEDGSLLSQLSPEDLPEVALLRGEFFGKKTEESLSQRRKAAQFILSLPSEGPLSRANVSEVTWSTDEGYALTLIEPKTEVKLGEGRVELKLLRVTQVLNYLSAKDLQGRVIDASFSKKVLVRLRKAP